MIAAVQLGPVLYSREGTVEKVCRQILALGREGVQFATFPETVVPYYPYFSFVRPPFRMGAEHHRLLEQAVIVPSAVTQAIGEARERAGIVASAGVAERDGGTLYNAPLLFDADGRLVLHRRKISPTYHERMVWGQGDGSGLRAVDSAVGRIGTGPWRPPTDRGHRRTRRRAGAPRRGPPRDRRGPERRQRRLHAEAGDRAAGRAAHDLRAAGRGAGAAATRATPTRWRGWAKVGGGIPIRRGPVCSPSMR